MRHQIGIADKGHGRKLPDGTTQWGGFEVDQFAPVDRLEDADRLYFQCPLGCSHQVAVDFHGRRTPDRCCVRNDQGVPVRWHVEGTGLHDLTTRPSILLLRGCRWHGFITNGAILTC